MKQLLKFSVLMFCLSALLGCVKQGLTIEEMHSAINTEDGVNQREAVLIAQKDLKGSGYVEDYNIKEPEVLVDFITRDFPEYWFVGFDAMNFEDMSMWIYLVVIERETGKIIHNKPYHSKQVTDYDWRPNDGTKWGGLMQ